MEDGKYIKIGPHADTVPVDDDHCDFGLDTTQEYFEKICDLLKVTRPSFAWGRNGNVPAGAWLRNNEVPSNRVGIPFNLNNGILEKFWVGNQNVNTFSMSIYEHDGNSTNLTLLATVTVTAARSKFFTPVDFGVVAVSAGKQIALRVANGTPKNPEVFVQISGVI